MATNARKNVKKGTSGVRGPAGTAAQRASKAGKIKGREQFSNRMARDGKPLPDSQGR